MRWELVDLGSLTCVSALYAKAVVHLLYTANVPANMSHLNIFEFLKTFLRFILNPLTRHISQLYESFLVTFKKRCVQLDGRHCEGKRRVHMSY